MDMIKVNGKHKAIKNIYFDKVLNMFCQKRATIKDKRVIGYMISHSKYYSDAITTISEAPISISRFQKRMIPVTFVDDFAEQDIAHGFWEVRE